MLAPIKKIDQGLMVNLIDRAVCEMTNRMTKLELVRTGPLHLDSSESSSLVIETTGDYKALLALSVENSLLWEITRKMKHKTEVSWGDLVVYTTEYFNVLCGFFLSHLNSNYHFNSRFGIPKFINKSYGQGSSAEENCINLFYQCSHGALQFFGVGLPVRACAG